MVPFRPLRDKLTRARRNLAACGATAGWGVLLWALALLLPWWDGLGSDAGLLRRGVVACVAAPPLLLAWTALQGQATVVMAVALLAPLPAWIAAPALAIGPGRPLPTLALVVVGWQVIATAYDAEGGWAPLRRLWRLPPALEDRLALALLPLLLGLGLLGEATLARLAGAVVLWAGIAHVPAAPRPATWLRTRRRLLARAMWLALCVVAAWLRPEAA